ncbi:class I SAM-dependent methyltransferase [Chryseobacterium vrystaatense]|uniref:Methyltransferase domain-containing protein n=1 Tax=Chryseobacterium vrystaatense TaxID=307480 RepID=A0A1M4TR65_9FLAO|nr:class I SAM-dependent methyltransferase [Chryseobacterium vrystaatense]SHE46885.1 Methyltransferase domain-containing protein [Chryseobacterium vrystaatense]
MKYPFNKKFYEFIDDEYKLYYLSPFVHDISNFLEHNKENYQDVLDFGCGYGELSQVFHQCGFNVTGIDMDEERISQAKIKFQNINFLSNCYDGILSFPDNSFDVIFSSSVLQYIDHDSFFLECKRILREGGCVIFIENLKNNPITRIGRAYLKMKKFNYQSYPWNHLSLNEISSMNKFFHLNTVKTYHFFGPLLYVSGFKMIKPLLKRVDQVLMKVSFVRRVSWLVLIIGKK